MKKSILLSLIIILFISCSEKEVNIQSLVERNGLMYEVNNSAPFSGKVFQKFNNEQFKMIGHYEKGEKTGEWIHYYSNGQIKKKVHYKNNILNGKYETYTENGDPLIKTNYLNGNYDGNYLEYNNRNTLLRDINYKNGQYQGSYKEYNNNGTLITETNYNNDLIEGKYLNYYDNGNIHYSYSMHQGNYVDDYKEYNKDGTIRKHKYYDKDGKKTNKGKWTIYYDTKWNEVGNPSEFYRIIDFTNNSNNNTIKVKDYYNNGSVQMEGTYSSIEPDIKDGIFKWFSKDGIVTMKGNYINGVKEGVWETYYDRKNIEGSFIKERAHYKNGKLNGKYNYWLNPNYSYADYSNENLNIYPELLKYHPQTNDGYWKLYGQLNNGKLNGKWKVWIMNRSNNCWYKLNLYVEYIWDNGNPVNNYANNKTYNATGLVINRYYEYAENIAKTTKPLYCR